ncbi:flagellar assembly factor FliW [Lachnospiraceae bacterium]|nr:flagellar assembly protein FliW [Eubacterium sp.]GFI25333.1 flagellar assembly factor FliW [Lachnospiraceae bacterium]
MKATTRLFGEIEIGEEKIVTIEQGIIGFPNLNHFTLIFDSEKEEKSGIMWLQSLDDGEVAIPVLVPTELMPEYNPTVNNELLEGLGSLTPENIYVLVTVTVPKDIRRISVNLKAPIIVNTDTNRGCQLIVEDDYEVRHNIYDLIKDGKEKAGE